MKNRRLAGLVASVATAALVLTACGGGDGLNGGSNGSGGEEGSTSAGGPGVDVGASKEEYIAAFEDVEPIELDFQMASSDPTGFTGRRDQAWADHLEEYSGGKITVNVHPTGSIAAPTDVPQALTDGRLDVANYFGTYEPAAMGAFVDLTKSLVQQPSSPLVGELVTQAVLLDVGFQTPEVIAAYEDRGMHVLHPAVPSGNTTMMCVEDKTSIGDFRGAQIRGNAQAHEIQAGALGGTLTSVELAEGYEALERGVLDCSLNATGTGVNVGWVEVAPFIKLPREASFAPGPGSMVVGSVWEDLPLAAQQLMFDGLAEYIAGEHSNAVSSVAIAGEATQKNGGNLAYLDDESETALAVANEEILASVEESTNLDGAALNDKVAESVEKWTAIAEELGYEETGEAVDFADWYEGSLEFENDGYFRPYADRIYEEIIVPNRPS